MRCLAWILVASLAAVSRPCAVASRRGSVLLNGEQSLIIWDAATHTEHFIRQASFDTTEPDFGFVVPTPTVPELGEVDAAVFQVLAAYIAPLLPIGRGAKSGASSGGPGVEVLQVQDVGDYRATTVRAKDGRSLSGWLAQNGYKARPALTQWCQSYAKKKWVFTALKFMGHREGQQPTKALRLSFKAQNPHYPYKMPKDTWPGGWQRPMTVYLVSSEERLGRYGQTKGDWEAQWVWSGEISSALLADIVDLTGLTYAHIPPRPVLTVLRNKRNDHGYNEDLEFCESPDPVDRLLNL